MADQQTPQQPPPNQQQQQQNPQGAGQPPQGYQQYPFQGPPPQGGPQGPPPTGDNSQQQWGPPQGQWGPPQGQWGSPQGQWGQQPPQGQWGPPQGQWGQQPPQGPWGQQPQGQGQPQPPQNQGQQPPQGPGQQPQGQGQSPQGQNQWGQQPPQGQNQWGPPPNQWGPPNQQWGQGPPQGQWGYQQQWGAYPQQGYQQGPPPQGGPQGYTSGPPQNYQQGPPIQQAPPQTGYQAPIAATGTQQAGGVAAPPSVGFTAGQKATGYDPTHDVEVIRKACKGFNTDEKALINTLVKLDPLQIESLNQKYTADTKKPLYSLIEDKTRGSLEDGLSALSKGPLSFYVWLVRRATEGVGTKEEYLDLALLGRSNADVKAMKNAFKAKYHMTMEFIIKDDLSGDMKRFFEMVMSATRTEESAGVNPQHVTKEVKILHDSTEGRAGTNEVELSRIFIKNNDATIAAIAAEYEKTYHISVETLIKNETSGHLEDSLLFILRGVQDKAKRDAELIEKTMAGIGTRDEELAYRLISAHWIPGAIPAIKAAYQRLYGKDLISRVRDETSGDFERLLVAILSK